MKTVRFPDGDEVPAIGQGSWMMGERPGNRAAEIAALRAGVDLGMTLIDTAEMYGDGAAEMLIAEALGPVRDEVFLVSKAYPQNASRQRLAGACEASLKRLRTDRLDLYLLHWRGSVPLRETVEAMAALQTAGKIRRWGVSNLDTDDMDELLVAGGNGCATNQILYNLGRRGPEHDLLPWLKDRRMPVMAYSPVEQGRLVTSPVLARIAKTIGATPVQVALAWVLRDDGVIAIRRPGQWRMCRKTGRRRTSSCLATTLPCSTPRFRARGCASRSRCSERDGCEHGMKTVIHPETPDGHYFVVRGRLWRRSNPSLSDEQRTTLVRDLMQARRAVGVALRSDDPPGLADARAMVDRAKIALGERGPVWWDDGAPDLNRHMVANTLYVVQTARWHRMTRDFPELPADAFTKQDTGDDLVFYAPPRLVTHIDEGAVAALTSHYRERVPDNGRVLDLMSSWVSHLPFDRTYATVVGHGMNADELAANPQLDRWFVQDLNRDATLPLQDKSFEAALCCVGVQYLQQPLAVFEEVRRVLTPGAPFIVSFSNRCFPTKAVAIWRALDTGGHARLIQLYLERAGFKEMNAELLSDGRAGDPLVVVTGLA